jgi:tetratricopeptide (TPR) repeat protein
MRRTLPPMVALLAMLAGQSVAQVQNPADKQPEAVTAAPLSPSAQRAAELDRLFGQLHAAEAPARSTKAIEEKIWAVWSRSESTTAELILSQASKAMAAQQYDAALPMLDELVKERPDFAEAWNRRATLFFQMRRYEQSLADIDKVLELEPRHFGALAGKGMIMLALERPSEALDAYREALAMNPHMESVIEAVKKLEKERPDI